MQTHRILYDIYISIHILYMHIYTCTWIYIQYIYIYIYICVCVCIHNTAYYIHCKYSMCMCAYRLLIMHNEYYKCKYPNYGMNIFVYFLINAHILLCMCVCMYVCIYSKEAWNVEISNYSRLLYRYTYECINVNIHLLIHLKNEYAMNAWINWFVDN